MTGRPLDNFGFEIPTFADCTIFELVEKLREMITHEAFGIGEEERGYTIHQLKSLVSWLENEKPER